MKNAWRIAIPILACLGLVAAVSSAPRITNIAAVGAQGSAPAPAPVQSVYGMIADIQPNSFTLTLAPSQSTREGEHLGQADSPAKSMTFMIDKNTTVQGTLEVGVNADVTYRRENGKNLAVTISVTP